MKRLHVEHHHDDPIFQYRQQRWSLFTKCLFLVFYFLNWYYEIANFNFQIIFYLNHLSKALTQEKSKLLYEYCFFMIVKTYYLPRKNRIYEF